MMPIEFFGEVSIYFGIGLQVMMALSLGGLVGYDREKKLKSAGIKTNILICLGATLYTSIGLLISVGAVGMADPNRVAAQIVSGIGFLGAGAIIQSQGSVRGMTTAATIWVVAAIGFTIGAGYPFTAAIFTVTVLVVLKLINPVYKYMESEKDYDYFQLDVLSKGSVRKTVRGIIENEEFDIDDMAEEPLGSGKKGSRILSVFMLAHRRHMERLAREIKRALKVQEVSYFSVSKTAFEEPEERRTHEKKNGKSMSKPNKDKADS
jgi:putative Mg2+ transporter-C (MgtC) family protein